MRKKVTEDTKEEELVHVLGFACLTVLPIGKDPYGKVIDDGRDPNPWLSSSGSIDRDPTNATYGNRVVPVVDAFGSVG